MLTIAIIKQMIIYVWEVYGYYLQEITSNLGAVVTTTNYERSDFNIEVKSVLEIPNVKYINLGTYKCATSQVFRRKILIS